MILPDGWLSDVEANELRRLARGRTVLELGAWKGRSTVVLAEVADYVVSVDRHAGIAAVGGEDSLPDYLAAVRDLSNVAIVVAAFDQMVPLLSYDFGMIYVDGDHDYVSVKRDAVMARSHCAPTGVVAFHDWDFDEVRQAAVDVMACQEFGSQPASIVGSVASWSRS